MRYGIWVGEEMVGEGGIQYLSGWGDGRGGLDRESQWVGRWWERTRF